MLPLLPYCTLPYARKELPGWGRLLRFTKVMCSAHDPRWKDAPTVTTRGKNHGYLMRLDLSNWSQRLTYFLGRYYEHGVQKVLDLALTPGARFVDIGANIGMITLHARALVGARGYVDAFEPNPECCALIRTHLAINGIDNVTLHACGLSDQADELLLNLTSDHSGTATLAPVGDVKRSIAVKVGVADELLAPQPPVDVIKIDVEGFELRVLNGLTRILENDRPIVITELIEAQLNRAATTVADVSAFLQSRGYAAFGIGCVRRGLQHDLKLYHGGQGCSDVVWVHPQSTVAPTFMAYVTAAQMARPTAH